MSQEHHYSIRDIIAHPTHGIGVVTGVEQWQLDIQWAEEGSLIIAPGHGRPTKVFKRDVRALTQQEMAIMQALHKLGHKELADAWIKEGRPHAPSPDERAIIEKVADIMRKAQQEDREPTAEEQVEMERLRDEALSLPEEKLSLHARVQKVIETAHAKKANQPQPLNGSVSNIIPFQPNEPAAE